MADPIVQGVAITRPNLALRYAIWNIPPEMWLRPHAAAKDLNKSPTEALAEEPEAMLHDADYDLEDDTDVVPKTHCKQPVLMADVPDHPKHQQAELVKTIGQRMRQARELCNLSQVEAAYRFGYSNPSKLSKIEGATDTKSVPLWIIVRAAQLYEVSIDFLFGASDDWETGARMTQERAVSAWLFGEFDRQQKMAMRVLYSLNDQIEAVADILPSHHAAALEVQRTLGRCRELNHMTYANLRGGANLESAVSKLIERTTVGRDAFKRFQGHLQIMRAASADTVEAADV
ncbi:helix-turn-helix transcriptional regulator [Alcaligenaceae bacterium]|nr:helix-turn-helix transcriptional regulator [Alcaligenaceae bacterium]